RTLRRPACWGSSGRTRARDRSARARRASTGVSWRGTIGRVAVEGEEAMRKVLELSEETYQQLATLAAAQQRPLEEMLRLCLLAYEQYQYHLVHQRCHWHLYRAGG